MTTTVALLRGRLRPVPWGWLTVGAASWLLATRALAAIPSDPEAVVAVIRWAAFLLGLGAAVLAAPETDLPREILRATPRPWWGTLVLRLAGWLTLGAAPVVALAVGLGGTAGWTTTDLGWGALPNLLLVTAIGFLAARVTSTLGGGAAALTAVVGLDLAGRAWPAWFPVQLHSVAGDPLWQASRVWMVAVSLALVTVALLVERYSGVGLGLPRPGRRRARYGPASKAGAGSC
jgi:hypothetical protein